MTSPSPSASLLSYFEYQHLPETLQEVSQACGKVALVMDALLPDSAEKTMGLRKLLEAKDCFVRAQVTANKVREALNA